jgi:uncharacterized tellurite resistance protein B-like protein
MPSFIQKVFKKSEASTKKDGLSQPQREAIVDLLNYCMYADNFVAQAEDKFIADTAAKFNCDAKISFDYIEARSIGNARRAKENEEFRAKFLASIRDCLATPAVKKQALELCQKLFLADGTRADKEDAMLLALRKLLA